MKYCFVFVCQQGELELKSMLLAASLRRYVRGDYDCVAAIPQPASRWGTISSDTLTLMQMLGVRSVPITNSIDENYPIGNKVACLGIETPAQKIIFLDSDILCLRELSLDTELTGLVEASFSAKPADLPTFTRDVSVWQQVYELFNLPLPDWRVIATASGELMLPYFNAGVIAIQNGVGFAEVWTTGCQKIDAEPSITNKRPWLEQIALPVAVTQLHLTHQCLDERFNYPAHLKPLPQSLPFLCHYHWCPIVRREPRLNQLVVELAEAYPLLKAMLLDSPAWAPLLKPYTLQKSPRRLLARPLKWGRNKIASPSHKPEAIITGIPRSGTSYLCRLLHTLQDCVVINEPTQIFEPLIHDLQPWRVATFYQELRRDILDGQPIENKLHNGQLIEDTAITDTQTPYYPQVTRPDFLLGTKNTLAYLARLPQLQYVLPQALIIACVRHPIDTIASWKTTFPHLREAKVAEFPVGHPNDPFLAGWQRHRLAEIAATSEEPLKRALLWRYLAECLLNNAHQIILVRYEELVQQPMTVLQTILRQTPNAPPLRCSEKITASTVRHKREVLDANDFQAIVDICGQYAIKLGYNLT